MILVIFPTPVEPLLVPLPEVVVYSLIKGISRMRKHELIEAIEHADPQFFQPWLDLVYGVQQPKTEGEARCERTDS